MKECDLFLTSQAFRGVGLKIKLTPQVVFDNRDLVKAEFWGEDSVLVKSEWAKGPKSTRLLKQARLRLHMFLFISIPVT